MYFTFVSLDAQTEILLNVFLPIDNRAKCDNIQFPIKFARVKIFSTMWVFGQRIARPTKSSLLLSQKFNLEVILIIFNSSKWLTWSIHLVLDKKETFLGINISGLPCTLNASLKLPAGASNLPPVTCGNCEQSIPAKNFVSVGKEFYFPIKLHAATASKFECTSFTISRKH